MSTSFKNFLRDREEQATPERRSEMEAVRQGVEALYAEHFALGDQLAALRAEQHLSQEELARRSGVRQPEISRIERGQANPTQETLMRLASALGGVLTITPTGHTTRRKTVSDC